MTTVIWDGMPAINGVIEAGIAAGVDPELTDNDKLHIPAGHFGARAASMMSAYWAYNRFSSEPRWRKEYAICAATAVLLGFAGHGDGDNITVPNMTPVPDEVKHELAFTQKDLSRCLTVMLGTKINWWLMNHHTGQGVVVGYAKKVGMVSYELKEEEIQDSGYTKFAHTVGHWCSTKFVLRELGIQHIVAYDRPAAAIQFKATEDLKLRLTSPPAGTHKHTVAVAAVKRLILHCVRGYCTVLPEMPGIISNFNRMMRAPARHHIGAKYLTGQDRIDIDDNLASGVLGRLGTFVKYFASASTLAASPHFSKGVGRDRVWKDVNYEDFDPNFDELCKALRSKSTAMDENTLREISKSLQITATGMEAANDLVKNIKNIIERKAVDPSESNITAPSSSSGSTGFNVSTSTVVPAGTIPPPFRFDSSRGTTDQLLQTLAGQNLFPSMTFGTQSTSTPAAPPASNTTNQDANTQMFFTSPKS